jgi:hypothetical protein
MSDQGQRLRRIAEMQPVPQDAFERLVERREQHRRRQRWTAGVVALVLTVGVVGGMLAVLSGLRDSEQTTTPAAEPSRDLSLDPGEYLYMKTSYSGGRGVETWESWWATDGSGRYELLSDAEDYGGPKPGTYGPGAFPVPGDLTDLSTDPDVLAEQLRERSAPHGASPVPDVTPGPGHAPESGTLWRAVQDLVRFPNATPELRAALFSFTQSITGVRRVDGVTDPGGRQAILLELDYGGYVTGLFFDPNTFQVTGTSDGEPGYGRTEMAIESGIVGSTRARPQGDEWLTAPATRAPKGRAGPYG